MAANLLAELTATLPDDIRLKVRECLDRTRIRNPNDPIYELMIVLGTWAHYYQTIPASIKAAGDAMGAQNRGVLESLDRRVELLRTLAQNIQSAIDRLDEAPQAIVNRFPSEMIARNLATRIDQRFNELPTFKLELELKSLATAIDRVTGKPGQQGLAERLDKELAGLKRSAEHMKQLDFVPDRLAWDIGFTLLGAGIVCSVMLIFKALAPLWDKDPDVRALTELVTEGRLMHQHMALIDDKKRDGVFIPATEIESSKRDPGTGDITIVFKK